MKKFLRIFLILTCLFIINISSVLAVDIDMNINNSNQNIFSNNYVNTNNTNDNNIENPITTPITPTKVSTTETSDNFELTVSDIINIILISVGIVLIFLSIAILIKIR